LQPLFNEEPDVHKSARNGYQPLKAENKAPATYFGNDKKNSLPKPQTQRWQIVQEIVAITFKTNNDGRCTRHARCVFATKSEVPIHVPVSSQKQIEELPLHEPWPEQRRVCGERLGGQI